MLATRLTLKVVWNFLDVMNFFKFGNLLLNMYSFKADLKSWWKTKIDWVSLNRQLQKTTKERLKCFAVCFWLTKKLYFNQLTSLSELPTRRRYIAKLKRISSFYLFKIFLRLNIWTKFWFKFEMLAPGTS